MSKRSWAILIVTGVLLVALVVLLLVPAPADNVEMIDGIVARLEGALGILFPASIHTLGADRAEKQRRETQAPPEPAGPQLVDGGGDPE